MTAKLFGFVITIILLLSLSFVTRIFAQVLVTPPSTVAWSPDGSKLAVSTWDGIVVYSASLQRIARLGSSSSMTNDLAWSPDSQRLASAQVNYNVTIWDVAAGKPLAELVGHTHQVTRVAWSPDGSKIASGSNDMTVRVWDAQTFALLSTIDYARTDGNLLPNASAVNAIAWSPEGGRLAIGDRAYIYLWDTALFSQISSFPHQANGEELDPSLFWTPDGQYLIGQQPELWDVKTSERRVVGVPCSTSSHNIASLSPNGLRLAASGWDSITPVTACIMTFDAEYNLTEQVVLNFEADADPVSSMAWSPDGTKLATVISNGFLTIWNSANGELTGIVPHIYGNMLMLLEPLPYCVGDEDLAKTLETNVNNNQIAQYIANIEANSDSIAPQCSKNMLLLAKYFLNNPTPTPRSTVASQALTLTALCSPTPDEFRVWKLTNPNPVEVQFTWTWIGQQPDQEHMPSGVVPAMDGQNTGERQFTTPTKAGDNTIIVRYHGDLNIKLSSNSAICPAGTSVSTPTKAAMTTP